MSCTSPRDEQTSVRLGALNLLCQMGWQRLAPQHALALRGSTREVILKPRLIEVLQSRRFDYKGASYPLSPGGIDQVLREVQALRQAEGLLPANERLYRMLTLGITVTEFMPDGKKHQPTIPLIDWRDTAANRWEVTQALAVLSGPGTHQRVPDIVAYVNGLPLVVIETLEPAGPHAGRATAREAIGRHLRNQRPDEVPQLFAYAQLLLALSRGEARYGTVGTPLTDWACWREQASSSAQRQQQDQLLAGLLTPARLLEFLRFFVLFDRKAGKVVARSHQFFGVRALLARVNQRKPDGAREGGVLWHTPGSGKRFTLAFCAKALLLHEKTRACRVLVVTDQPQLLDRLSRNLVPADASSVAMRKAGGFAPAGSGRQLARRLGQGSERIVFSRSDKLATALRLPECHNPSADLVVLVDEVRRSDGAETHERLRKALPRAACVAFTGTPLREGEQTAHAFGPLVHAYTLQAALQDGTVAPLLYEQRLPERVIDPAAVTRWFDKLTAGLSPQHKAALIRKFTDRRAAYGAPERIELIAWDIAQHFHAHVKQQGLGLKGQVAAASRRDAIRYRQYLQDTGLVSSAVVLSSPDSREGDTGDSEAETRDVQAWWNAQVGRRPDAYEDQVLANFATDGEPDLLIVVDRLLTGFHEPRNAVLYIDKPLSRHSLIQAVARVNRLHEGKRCGWLVDYRGSLKDLAIDGLCQPFSTDYERLPGLHQALWARLAGMENPGDRAQWRQALRDEMDDALTDFGRCLQTALSSRSFFEDPRFPPDAVRTYQRDLLYFDELRQALRRDAQEPVSGTQVREPATVYLAHRQDRQVEGVPGALEGNAPARAWFDICRLVMGEEATAGPGRAQWVEQALAIDAVVRHAVAEHSLNPQDVEAAIRQALLPRLFGAMGLDKARQATEQVIQATRRLSSGQAP